MSQVYSYSFLSHFQFQKAFMSQLARPAEKYLSKSARKYLSEKFNLEEGSISETEIGRRQHPKMFGGKSVRNVLTKFTRYVYFIFLLTEVSINFNF